MSNGDPSSESWLGSDDIDDPEGDPQTVWKMIACKKCNWLSRKYVLVSVSRPPPGYRFHTPEFNCNAVDQI